MPAAALPTEVIVQAPEVLFWGNGNGPPWPSPGGGGPEVPPPPPLPVFPPPVDEQPEIAISASEMESERDLVITKKFITNRAFKARASARRSRTRTPPPS